MFVSCLKFSPHVGASDCLYVEVSLRCGESLPVMSPPPTWGRCTQAGPAARSPCRFNAANWVCTVLTWCAPSAAHTAPVSPALREGGRREARTAISAPLGRDQRFTTDPSLSLTKPVFIHLVKRCSIQDFLAIRGSHTSLGSICYCIGSKAV